MVYSMHKVPVMLFSLSPSGHSTFLIRTLMLCGLPHIISPFPFIHFFSGELFHPFCITVTHGPCNTFSLFSSGHSTFLLPLSHLWPIIKVALCGPSYVFCHFLNGTVPFFLCYARSLDILLLFPSGHSLYYFFLSYWWSVPIVALSGFYALFSRLLREPILLSFVWMSHKFYVRHLPRL